MRLLVIALALLLAGCSDAPAAEPISDVADKPVDEAPIEAPVEANVTELVVAAPRVFEFELYAGCSVYLGGVYARPCPSEDGALGKTDFQYEVAVENATAMVVEVELTEGSDAQLLAGEGASSYFHREAITGDSRFVITSGHWGALKDVVFEIQGAEHVSESGVEVWASGPTRMEVTVTAFDDRPTDLDTYCARC